jgi:hypothetical protein
MKMINKDSFLVLYSCCAPIFIGIGTFMITVGPDILDPSFISWIADGDPMQQYLGWIFFQQDFWRSPVGLNPRFGMGLDASIVYSDSTPLAALFFKVFKNFLSEPFQYFGWWTLLCFILQGVFAWFLSGLISKKSLLRTLATSLIVFSLPMIWRLGFHHYLLAQFLILAGIYLNLVAEIKFRQLKWGLLLTSAILINFYVFLMVMALWLGNLFDWYSASKVTLRKLILELTSLLTILLFFIWQAGYFSIKSSLAFETGTYGDSRLNLLTLFDANGYSALISYLIPNLRYYAGENYESFHFLGLGILFLLPFCIYGIIRNTELLNAQIKSHKYLIIFLVLLTFFAITNRISIGSLTYVIPIPEQILALATSLRSSGRLFLPGFYMIVFLVLFIVARTMKKSVVVFLFAIALILQVFDSMPAWNVKRTMLQKDYKRNSFDELKTPLNDKLWDIFSVRYKNLVTVFELPKKGVIPSNWAPFANLAAKHGLQTNSAYLARYDEQKLISLRDSYEGQIQTGKYDENTLYVVDDEYIMPVLARIDKARDLFVRIDGFNVIAPNWNICNSCPTEISHQLINESYPTVHLGETIKFGREGKGFKFLVGIDKYQIHGWGWAYPESWGVWSEGNRAKVVLPIPSGNPKTLELDFRAFINPQNPRQRIEIFVNGSFQKRLEFTSDQGNKVIIKLPDKIIKDYVSLEFKLVDAKSPKELGVSDDNRKLAVGLTSANFW